MKTFLILNITSGFLISILLLEFLFAGYSKYETEYILTNETLSPNNHCVYFQKNPNLIYIPFEITYKLIEQYQCPEIQNIVNKIHFININAFCNTSGENSKRSKIHTNGNQPLKEKAKTPINKVIIGHSINGMVTY
ncbi:hypothetical protein [Aequorivita antarctica]|uniref:Uncharacterized protein n=1 Tax=Aequorivita antarctica TaxID=153266 RepID=A0A5C6YZR1_9FLAO|nr:hypothetical protein [Aequorivita antarctica]TXD73265.1 hypothetical protein ESU54_09000 [Aequorivita antarctica]SRX76018.1 hypothetical protein AEQU3_03016 [Aequorivita antarctica]